MTRPPPTALDPHAEDFPLKRLDELYQAKAYEHGDHLVDEILEIYPNTETAAQALWIRSLHRRTRGHQEEALQDLLIAADQGTGSWSLRSAHRAGVHCQLLDWRDRAQVVFEQLIGKWPRLPVAARAAAELAWNHRGTEKAQYWERIQIDILHLLVCDPTPDSDDDLDALMQAIEFYLERPEEGGEPKDVANATSCAQELLARATDRRKLEYIGEAELALIAIESGRPLNLVQVLESQGDDPRLSLGGMN
jgi:hypothetical protein